MNYAILEPRFQFWWTAVPILRPVPILEPWDRSEPDRLPTLIYLHFLFLPSLSQNLSTDLQSVRPSTPNMVMYDDDDPIGAKTISRPSTTGRNAPPPMMAYEPPPDLNGDPGSIW